MILPQKSISQTSSNHCCDIIFLFWICFSNLHWHREEQQMQMTLINNDFTLYTILSFYFLRLFFIFSVHSTYYDVSSTKHYWDNATEQWIFSCQHGAKECRLNLLHGCILANMQFEQAFEIISCFMKSVNNNLEDVSDFNYACCCCLPYTFTTYPIQ